MLLGFNANKCSFCPDSFYDPADRSQKQPDQWIFLNFLPFHTSNFWCCKWITCQIIWSVESNSNNHNTSQNLSGKNVQCFFFSTGFLQLSDQMRVQKSQLPPPLFFASSSICLCLLSRTSCRLMSLRARSCSLSSARSSMNTCLLRNAVAKPTSSVPKRIGFVRRFPADSLDCFMLLF